jgi:flagellar hook protein FlgE
MGLGSSLGSIDTVMTQGALQQTGNATDVGIKGNGFFILSAGQSTSYTRAGNFSFDDKGNLVSSSGALVQGWQMPFTRGGTTAGGPVTITSTPTTPIDTSTPYGNIQVPQNLVLGPQPTSLSLNPQIKDKGIIMKGNLDSNSPLNAGDPGVAGYPAAGTSPSATTSATVYDSLGKAHTITFNWYQTANTPTLSAAWQWAAYDTTGGLPIGTAAPAVPGLISATYVGHSAAAVTFNADGSLATNGAAPVVPPNNDIITIPTALLSGAHTNAATGYSVSVNLGTPNNSPAAAAIGLRDGITGDYGDGQNDPVTNVYIPKQTIYTAATDGYSEGTLTGVSVDETGGINCQFSNNQIVTMAKIAMANFTNPQGLVKVGGTDFMQSANSGTAQVSTAGNAGLGTTEGGYLEASNVDLSVELTNMIIAQRGFEANARIVSTSSEMLTTLVQLGR